MAIVGRGPRLWGWGDRCGRVLPGHNRSWSKCPIMALQSRRSNYPTCGSAARQTLRCEMDLNVLYDHAADVLRLMKGEDEATSATLLDEFEIVLSLATEDGHHIVGIDIMGASSHLPLGKSGYDQENDELTLGSTLAETIVTENGDIVGYWMVDAVDPEGFMDPVGVVIRHASRYLAQVRNETQL